MKKMKKVEKKILPCWFKKVVMGDKTFEFRKDEDDIQEGDLFVLKEWENGEYTGKWCICDVGTVLRHSDWPDIPQGFCIISLCRIVECHFD